MEIKTKCGVFGCYDTEKIDLNYVVKGLMKQQHRGRESCGISYVDNANVTCIVKARLLSA